ncbi:MAG: 3-hydroxyacyl-CoA dehydrogenase family protein [Butyricicoccaceae bacterium]
MEIKTVTVIGANGTMGCNISGIFASFGNAKVYMACRSLEKAEKAVGQAAKSVRAEAIAENLVPVTFEDLPQCVAESDLVFESVSENFETKQGIIDRIADHVRPDVILATGTSGLSIDKLAEMYPENLRSRFIGMHFFNPPYMLTLCEIINSEYTDPEMSEFLSTYSEDVLVRTVVKVKDTAAFLGNRIGFQFINEACQYAEKYKDNGGIDYIDAILGQFTGRNMAPIATADFVGLDVHKAIVDNVYQNTKDYARATFVLPEYVQKLIDEGKLGRKVNQGLYKSFKDESGKRIQLVYDIDTGEYREKMRYTFPFARKMVDNFHSGNYKEAFDSLINNHSIEAEICVSFLIKYVLYGITVAKLASDDVRAADDAMATGFGWVPPLAVIDAFGGKEEFAALARDRMSSEFLAGVKLDETLADIPESSEYDYRSYFKGKK